MLVLKMKKHFQKLLCVVGMIAAVGLGAMSLPSHFMATPMEEKAYHIMQDGLKQDVKIGSDQDDLVIMSHYANWNSQEWVMKSRIMLLASAGFFVLFMILLILDSKKGKPTKVCTVPK